MKEKSDSYSGSFWLWMKTNGKIIVILSLLLIVSISMNVFVFSSSDTRVIYSLNERRNDQELIRLINDADKYVYFAIYFFTKEDIADALIRAKNRGVIVRGIMDAKASLDSNRKVKEKLENAGIHVETQKHQDGIMHIKTLITEDAYASGSYNWTQAATEANDEVLEIGNDRSIHRQYLSIIKNLLIKNE